MKEVMTGTNYLTRADIRANRPNRAVWMLFMGLLVGAGIGFSGALVLGPVFSPEPVVTWGAYLEEPGTILEIIPHCLMRRIPDIE